MSDDLPILDELRRDLSRAMRTVDDRRRTRSRGALGALVAVFALAVAGSGAAGAAYLVLRASPIAPFRAADSPPEQRVAPGTSRVLSLRAADPRTGRPPWALRLARSQTGLVCGTIAQVVGDRFGLVGLDGRFRELPEPNADACGQPEGAGLAQLGSRVLDADRPADVRTVVNGVAGERLEHVAVSVRGGRAHEIPHSPEGAFLLVLRGRPEDSAPRVTLRWRDGRTATYALASARDIVVDPEGGSGWRVYPDAAGRQVRERHHGRTYLRAEFNCARAARAHNSSYPPSGARLCGRDRFPVGGRDRTLYYGARRLPRNGGRTALWGRAASDLVASVLVTGPGGIRASARPGTFLVVLPGWVDPATLRVTLRMRDGTTRTTGPNAGLVRAPRAVSP